MLVDTLKAQARDAMKAKDAVASQILRLALGEIQTGEARANRAATDEDAVAVLRKLIKSNEETLEVAEDAEQRAALTREIAVLTALLPATWDPARIAEALGPVAEAIRAAKSDGQATGIAMKHLKAAGASVTGADVAAAVRLLRA